MNLHIRSAIFQVQKLRLATTSIKKRPGKGLERQQNKIRRGKVAKIILRERDGKRARKAKGEENGKGEREKQRGSKMEKERNEKRRNGKKW